MTRFNCIRIWLLALCLSVASECATIVSRSEYDIPVSCNMPGVTVNVYKDGEEDNATIQ